MFNLDARSISPSPVTTLVTNCRTVSAQRMASSKPPCKDGPVILVGIGGASCSGKTTLAKHLEQIIPQSYLIHQDDYAPPEEQIPFDAVHTSCRNWDAAPTAIEWDRFVADLKAIKAGSELDESKRSHEHLALLTPVPVPDSLHDKWKDRLREALSSGHKPKIVLVEGFLLYWHPGVSDLLDVRILIRERKEVLEQRRTDRNTRIADESFWKDPPGVFDNIVWPAYSAAHSKHFTDGDVETGRLLAEQDIVLLEAAELSMADMVEATCQSLENKIKEARSAKESF